MAHWSLPIPVLDPLFDAQVLAWREAFDFDWSLECQPADGPSLRPRDSVHGNTCNRPRQISQDASRDVNRA